MTFNIIIPKHKTSNTYMIPTLSMGSKLCQGNKSECWDMALNSRELENTKEFANPDNIFKVIYWRPY